MQKLLFCRAQMGAGQIHFCTWAFRFHSDINMQQSTGSFGSRGASELPRKVKGDLGKQTLEFCAQDFPF